MVWVWAGFILFILVMLALDLGVFHRHAHVVSVREALTWSAIWMSLGLTFAVFIYLGYEHKWMGLGLAVDAIDGRSNDGASAVMKYLTGYVVEKSLSVDNVFVIAMIFGFMAVPRIYQHRVLFWGILGALVMRGAMIAIGAELIVRYHWILYVFGVFLLATAVKMLITREHGDPSRNIVVRWTKRLFPVTDRYHDQHFIVRAGSVQAPKAAERDASGGTDSALERALPGALMLTPLALALVLVESTDLIFAVDSIPAVFAITADPFLVFTCNVFAILGLRSLYFALADMIDRFRFLKLSLAMVLAIVGLKMLFVKQLKSALGSGFNIYLLGVVLLILTFGILGSLWAGPAVERETMADQEEQRPPIV